MAKTESIAALRPEIWARDLFADVIDNLFFTQSGMMGKDDNNVIQIRPELSNKKGDTVTFGLTAKLSGDGIAGDSELEGNEEKISAFSEQVIIDQIRQATRNKGKLDEQVNGYDMRKDARDKLSIWMQEFIEMQFFLKAGGVTNTTLTNVAGDVVAGRAAWSNTPTFIPDADTAAGIGDRYLGANASGAASLAITDLITPALISRAKLIAVMASPKIRPLRINGRNHFVMFIHPHQAFDLKRNPEFAQAMREAESRGKDNPIFTGALGVWDGVIIHEHEYVPSLDITVAGHSFRGAAAGTDFTADAFRALLCGRQAVGFAQAMPKGQGWVEKLFDFDNQFGVATAMIGGIQKLLFDSKEYGVVALDTSASIAV